MLPHCTLARCCNRRIQAAVLPCSTGTKSYRREWRNLYGLVYTTVFTFDILYASYNHRFVLYVTHWNYKVSYQCPASLLHAQILFLSWPKSSANIVLSQEHSTNKTMPAAISPELWFPSQWLFCWYRVGMHSLGKNNQVPQWQGNISSH